MALLVLVTPGITLLPSGLNDQRAMLMNSQVSWRAAALLLIGYVSGVIWTITQTSLEIAAA